MKKNMTTKIMAFLALFWILIGMIGTGILIFVSPKTEQTVELTPEELQKLISETTVQTGSQNETQVDVQSILDKTGTTSE